MYRHCQLVQYYISQTLSYCWGNQSINTRKSLSVQYYISQTHSYCWGNQSINTYMSVSPVLHQSNTQLLLRQPVHEYMQVTVSPIKIISVRHTAAAEATSPSIYVSHCQLVQYYISQTHSCCWGNQSINTCKSLSVSPVLYQSNTQLLLRQPVHQYMQVTVSPIKIISVRHTAAAEAISQSIHV